MRRFLVKIWSARGNNLIIPHDINFEWGVVLFAIGIGAYFALPFEPVLWSLCVLSLILGGALYILQQGEGGGRFALIVMFLLLLGFTRSTWHTAATASPILPNYERAYTVHGWINTIETSGNRKRWEIYVQSIEGVDPGDTPLIVRTTATGTGFKAGDGVTVRSILSAPPGPVLPGGFDPARRAFFKRIGGYGFSISKASSYRLKELPAPQKIRRVVVKLRYGIANRVRAAAPQDTAGLQTSLLTGIRSYIPEEQTNALRTAGLAHILAISGLHMGLVAFGSYSLITLFLACILPLSRRYDVRKASAVVGLVIAAFYLILSGGAIATQRAFIMVSIVFLAVILDRRALSMRSVALAALITLLWHPEALLSAGFQMSFSAVAALIVVYRYWDERRTYKAGIRHKVGGGMASLSVTSIVAGFATSGFAVLHFNRIATYGLAGNLIAMPIFTFWVMPAAIAVFPALLIGLEAYPLWIMGKGLEVVLAVSIWVESQPGALVHIKAGQPWLVALYGLAFTCLCLGPKPVRLIGGSLIFISCLAWIRAPIPDIRVSDDGKVAYWGPDKPIALYVESRRGDRYGREQFVRASGASSPDIRLQRDNNRACDKRACRTKIKNQWVSITEYPEELIEECSRSKLVVLTSRAAGPIVTRTCAARIIDHKSLAKSGAVNVYIQDSVLEIVPALTQARARRPWG